MKILISLFFLSLNLFAISLGETLFNGNCVTCHTTTVAKSAPTIQHIQKVYKERFFNKKEFVEFMANWVVKPDKDTALMKEEIQRYEIMPELGFDTSTISLIAEYIYELK
jgi:mono/diheme cytochrome c family protein